MSNEMYRLGQMAALEKFAALSALAQQIKKPAVFGGSLGAALSSMIRRRDDESLDSYLKRVAKGTVLGASLGAGVGLHGATRDPAAIAEVLKHLRRPGYRDNAILKRVVPAVAEHGRDVVRLKGIDPNKLDQAIAEQIYPTD